MEAILSFDQVLEAADQLPLAAQETLVDILRHRIVDEQREALATDIRAAEQEFEAGHCRAVTPDELVQEVY
jgi:hypothetical protein